MRKLDGMVHGSSLVPVSPHDKYAFSAHMRILFLNYWIHLYKYISWMFIWSVTLVAFLPFFVLNFIHHRHRTKQKRKNKILSLSPLFSLHSAGHVVYMCGQEFIVICQLWIIYAFYCPLWFRSVCRAHCTQRINMCGHLFVWCNVQLFIHMPFACPLHGDADECIDQKHTMKITIHIWFGLRHSGIRYISP